MFFSLSSDWLMAPFAAVVIAHEELCRSMADVDNILRDLRNSLYPTKAEFINCFIIHSK